MMKKLNPPSQAEDETLINGAHADEDSKSERRRTQASCCGKKKKERLG